MTFFVTTRGYSLNITDTSAYRYFPLNVGDTYIYLRITDNNGSVSSTYIRASISRDTVINSRKYFLYDIGLPWMRNNLLRTDTLTGSLYKYDTANSCIYYYFERQRDSLGAGLNEIPNNCPLGNLFKCTSINGISIWGLNTEKKTFFYETQFGGGGGNEEKSFIKDIGYYFYRSHYHISGFYENISYTLKGCVINGILYGDTSLTTIENISAEVPNSFTLYQNYPNPFNPVTKIKFDIPFSSFSKLTIWNSEGRLIENLYKGNLSAGSYEIDFNGSNRSSGIYYYFLETNGYMLSKKMILLK